MKRPIDPYDPYWTVYNSLYPNRVRSVGAAAAEGEGDGEGDGEDGGDGDGDGAEAAKAEAEAKAEADKKAAGQAGTADWRASIEDKKLRDHAGRFTSPGDLTKAHLDLRKELSAAIRIPGEDATDEQKAEFREKLGVPKDIAGYQIAAPEGTPEELAPDGETVQSFLQAVHPEGATPGTVNAAVNWFYQYLADGAEAKENAEKKATDEGIAALKKEFGGDEAYKAETAGASRAARAFGGDDFVKFLETTEVGGVKLTNHPAFIKPFAVIGRRMSEDGIHVGLSEEDTASAETKLANLTSQIHDAAAAGKTGEVNRLSKEREALSDKIYGDTPIVGGAGRAL